MCRHLEFKTSNLDNHLDITNNAKGRNITPHMKCDHHLKKLSICSHFFLMSAFGSTVGLKKFQAGGLNQPTHLKKYANVKLELISPIFRGENTPKKIFETRITRFVVKPASSIWAPQTIEMLFSCLFTSRRSILSDDSEFDDLGS